MTDENMGSLVAMDSKEHIRARIQGSWSMVLGEVAFHGGI
jgi:hypothetical protein